VAHFETYILNYNGLRFLPRCLDALSRLKLDTHTLTVNVVDNNSQDGSEQLIDEEYPWVNYIPLAENYGFSKGNNLGVEIRIAELAAEGRKADFHVLLNNDTEVEEDWLIAAYEVFARDEKIGVVGSCAVFDDSFIPISIRCDNGYCPADYDIEDERQLGSFFQYGYTGSNICAAPGRIKFKNAYPGAGHGCFLEPSSNLFIPVSDASKDSWVMLYMDNYHPAGETLSLQIRIGNSRESQRVEIKPGMVNPVAIQAPKENYRRYIQNAGSYVTSDWYAGDRGFLEEDGAAFKEVEQVASVCGVSMFVRDELWQKLNGFDEAFFAYYEDTDLSIRAQQLGYRCVYTPHSRLRHVHCGSGVEFSEYFLRNVTWSHLLFSSKTMNRPQWRHKLQESKRFAYGELSAFEEDHLLVGKPNLQAYCRYLRQYPTFIANRLQAYRSPAAQTLSGLLTPAVISLALESES
jgi:GT2 family glycosyltransferase